MSIKQTNIAIMFFDIIGIVSATMLTYISLLEFTTIKPFNAILLASIIGSLCWFIVQCCIRHKIERK